MPDWTYQTVFRPVLSRLPYAVAQNIAFRPLGLLGRFTIGRAVIQFLGHGIPPREVMTTLAETQIASPVGLGCGVDLQAQATPALALFGFGLIEVGPVATDQDSVHASTDDSSAPQWDRHGLSFPRRLKSLAAESVLKASERDLPCRAKLLIRLDDRAVKAIADRNDSDVLQQLANLPQVLGFVIRAPSEITSEQDDKAFVGCLSTLRELGRPVFLRIPHRQLDSLSEGLTDQIRAFDGTVVDLDGDRVGSCDASPNNQPGTAARGAKIMRRLKDRMPTSSLLASGAITDPGDAVTLLQAGADAVLVTGGFAAAGPGLPKRINDAIVCQQRTAVQRDEVSQPLGQLSWFWSFLMGLALTVGGLLALVIGWTRVVLPYDEDFLNLQRQEICSLNDQLLPFMSHDRVTLAGTMLALGPLYLALAWFGDRRGQHWARVAVIASAMTGFLSFFSFLGFGYFDPFHAFISAVLFQLMALGLHSSPGRPTAEVIDLRNSTAWRRALWGQLLMVIQGVSILIAGITVCTFGMTTVFVQQDLEFLQASRESIAALNPKLVPLVAHDRATFGGMLMATGITVLLSALWGWRKGRRWLWWTLLLSGTAAYSTTIVIHWWVGYTSLIHLLPAYGGLTVLWIAMTCSRTWLCDQRSQAARTSLRAARSS